MVDFGLGFMVVVGGWVMVVGGDCGFVGFTVFCFCLCFWWLGVGWWRWLWLWVVVAVAMAVAVAIGLGLWVVEEMRLRIKNNKK